MYLKRVNTYTYYYMSVRISGKITTIYLGHNPEQAKEKEALLRNELGIGHPGRPHRDEHNPRFVHHNGNNGHALKSQAIPTVFFAIFLLLGAGSALQLTDSSQNTSMNPQPYPTAGYNWTFLRWESSGKTMVDQNNPGRMMHVSSTGEKNVNLGNGSYAPYAWDPSENSLRFGDAELRMAGKKIECWINGSEKAAFSVNPEMNGGSKWMIWNGTNALIQA